MDNIQDKIKYYQNEIQFQKDRISSITLVISEDRKELCKLSTDVYGLDLKIMDLIEQKNKNNDDQNKFIEQISDLESIKRSHANKIEQLNKSVETARNEIRIAQETHQSLLSNLDKLFGDNNVTNAQENSSLSIDSIIKQLTPNRLNALRRLVESTKEYQLGDKALPFTESLKLYSKFVKKFLILQTWTEIFFRYDLYKNQKIDVSFSEKKDGVQLGYLATVKFDKDRELVYHIKTHQNGSTTSSCGSTLAPIDMKEIFVYKFLELSHLGPKVQFTYNQLHSEDFYILSEDLGDEFKTFSQLAENENFYDLFGENKQLSSGILYLNVVSKLFYLIDTKSNRSNFGFVCLNNSEYKLKLVDFQIETIENFKLIGNQDLKDRLLDLTSSISGENKYNKYFKFTHNLMEKDSIVYKFLVEINFLDIIEKANCFTISYIENNKQYIQKTDRDIALFLSYVEKIIENIQNSISLFKPLI